MPLHAAYKQVRNLVGVGGIETGDQWEFDHIGTGQRRY